MKKLFIVFLALITILCSCSKNSSETEKLAKLANSFTAAVDITYNELSISGDISRTADNKISLTVNSPEALKGLTFNFDGNNTTVSYYGISFELPENTASAKACINAISLAIDNALNGTDTTKNQKDGKLEINGKIADGEYTAIINEKTGIPLSIIIPDLNLSCTFSSFNS